jgi:hypothetical protein
MSVTTVLANWVSLSIMKVEFWSVYVMMLIGDDSPTLSGVVAQNLMMISSATTFGL